MKRSNEMFIRVLDALLMYGSLTKASKASGIDPLTLSRWRKASEDGDEAYLDVDYRGLIQPFHAHVEDTIEQSIDEIESNFRGSARDGLYRPIIWHGEYCYEPDEAAATMSDEEFADAVDLGIVWPDKLKRVRDEHGEWTRVKMMEWLPPTTEAQTIVLRSWSERYADRRSINFKGSLDVNQTLGVTVMGTPRVAPPPQQLQVITPQVADVINDNATDAVYADIDDDETELEDEPMSEIIPEPFEPDPASPLSPVEQNILARARSQNKLEADLAARLLNRPKSKPATARPAPPPPTYRGDLNQDDSVQRDPVGKKIV
jgi:hypothetical protein